MTKIKHDRLKLKIVDARKTVSLGKTGY